MWVRFVREEEGRGGSKDRKCQAVLVAQLFFLLQAVFRVQLVQAVLVQLVQLVSSSVSGTTSATPEILYCHPDKPRGTH